MTLQKPNRCLSSYIFQVRTARVITTVNGTGERVPGNATRFSGIAIKQSGSLVLQFVLEDLMDGKYILG